VESRRTSKKGKGKPSQPQQLVPKRPCCICDETGHFPSACKLLDVAKKAISSKSNDANPPKADEAQITEELHLSVSLDETGLVLDGGATSTFIKDRHLLTDVVAVAKGEVIVGNKEKLPINASGKLTIAGDHGRIQIKAYYVPHLHRNLVSENQLRRNGFEIFKPSYGQHGRAVKNGTIIDLYDHDSLTFIKGNVITSRQAIAEANQQSVMTIN
jgi:hypothetical protein